MESSQPDGVVLPRNNKNTPNKRSSIPNKSPHRNDSLARDQSTIDYSRQTSKTSQVCREPETIIEYIHAFFTNSYIEFLTTGIAIAAVFTPNFVSFAITFCTQIFLIGIPSHSQISKAQPIYRLTYFEYATKFIALLILGTISLKVYLYMQENDDHKYLESFGIFVEFENKKFQNKKFSIFASFVFEISTLLILIIMMYATHQIKKEVIRSQRLNLPRRTFYQCESFVNLRKVYKYCFVLLSAIEVLTNPDLLALFVLFLFLVLMVSAMVYQTAVRDQATMAEQYENDFHSMTMRENRGIVGWAMRDSRLFNIMMGLQKFFMMIQLFEFLLMHTYWIQQEIIKENQISQSSRLTHLFNFLLWIGNAEYHQEEKMIATDEHYYNLILTALIIFFAQMTKKAYERYRSIDYQEQNQNLREKPINILGLKISRVLFLNSDLTMEKYKSYALGFLPVLLCWVLRISIALWAYMYNSYVSFFHLLWVLLSFFVSQGLFYDVSVILVLPFVCFEFSLVYINCIPSFKKSYIYDWRFIKEYKLQPVSQFWELILMFSILVMLSLMYPARQRFKAYNRHHNGSDMKKDLILKTIQNPESNVFWKILFVILLKLHTLIIFLMLFAGKKDFTLFQLGFMFAFVFYSAFNSLYKKTSILLPLFISFFIAAQYFWSVNYKKWQEGYDKRDFLYMVDGWQPPKDPQNFYWARLPNLKLWGLLLLMNTLHEVAQMFKDQAENEKLLKLCDEHINTKYPLLTKWLKRLGHIGFMLLLVMIFSMMAIDLVQQTPNLFNLIYLIIFTVTFGKMCTTSLDGNSTKDCLKLAWYIKAYSAAVLLLTVIYHLMRFEFLNQYLKLDDTLKTLKDQNNFFVVNMKFLGIAETASDTTKNVQLYTTYLIIGQFLHAYFHGQLQSQEGRELFDWNKELKTKEGVQKALEFSRFDKAYFVYNLFDIWPYLDLLFTYFHFITNGVIVYYSITISISFFYAVHLCLIVIFYTYSNYKLSNETTDISNEVMDLQMATEASRVYKKKSHEIFLNIRKKLWDTQYQFTLLFVFAGYLNPMVNEMIATADGSRLESLKTIQFYMFWLGVTYPQDTTQKLQGLMPVHIMILFILCEKQAQNWLYSRWGLNKTLISKFAHLDYLLSLMKKGKDVVPVNNIDLLNLNFVEQRARSRQENELWRVEDLNNEIIFLWRQVKQNSQGDELSDAELLTFQQNLQSTLKLQLNLKQGLESESKRGNHFKPIKTLIEKEIAKYDLINLQEIPFLSISEVFTLRHDIFQQIESAYLNALEQYAQNNGQDLSEILEEGRIQLQIRDKKRLLQKYVRRRYSNSMWSGARLIYEQISLILLLTSAVIKCNIISLVYLVLVSIYLWAQNKQSAMRNQVYVISFIFILQYWLYLLNLTSASSPSKFPETPYPNQEDPYGKHLIPIMYKFQWARNLRNAYFFSFGVEIFTVQTLIVDFWNLALVAMYMYYYGNPVLSTKVTKFCWEQRNESDTVIPSENEINFRATLEKYTILMQKRYPELESYTKQKNKTPQERQESSRLREIKDECSYYLIVKQAPVLIFTTCHIFSMFVILLFALCRRSLVSVGYVIALLPYLKESRSVLRQHQNYKRSEERVQEEMERPEFQMLSPEAQKEHIEDIKKDYSWPFVNLVQYYLIWYSYLDFASQVLFQIPYLPNLPALDLIGLRKNYPNRDDSLDYDGYIKQDFFHAELNIQNLLMFFLNCLILCAISTQSEIFKSVAYRHFIITENEGLDLLMKMAEVKKWTITYAYNNEKMMKILAVQKTQEQIWGTVERIKENVKTFQSFYKRKMLEQYAEIYETDLQLPKKNRKKLISQPEEAPIHENKLISGTKRLAMAIQQEKERREKLVTQQALHVVENLLPWRASVYLFMMKFTCSVLFIQRRHDLEVIKEDMESGRYNADIDLHRHIRTDLYTILIRTEEKMVKDAKKQEIEAGTELPELKRKMEEWPELKLGDLRKTSEFTEWLNIIPEWVAALVRIIISNTQTIAYISMISSLYTNAGIIALPYPFAVFGMALLEETRPRKRFWRFTLKYSLVILGLKFISNLTFMQGIMQHQYFVYFDGYAKFGLHHMAKTRALVLHMVPEMLIVASILCNEIVEQLSGLYETSETEVESVPQAIQRIFEKVHQERDEQLKEQTLKEDSIEFIEGIERNQNVSGGRSDMVESGVPSMNKKSSWFWDHEYFKRLFPRIQQQKPGTDYYRWLTITQMILCWYLLNKFNLFSATGPYQEQNIFQNEMVIVLFVQICIMVFERYIARTENRLQIERVTKTDQELKPTIKNNQLYMETDNDQDLTVRLVIQKLKFQDLRDKQHMETLSKLKYQQDSDIALTDTVMTIQQKCKYLLHWANLILVHAYIFYYVPLSTNEVLYGSSNCNENSAYGCKEFRLNEHLKTFYLIYCFFFYFSAKQISQGLPSLRRGSSIYLLEGGHYMYDDEWANILAQTFCWLPLTMECRCLIDFCFSGTALDMWQTMQLFQYHYDYYIAKTSHFGHNQKEVGAPRDGFPDLYCWGYALLICILYLMLGPFYWLSGFNSDFISYNPILKSDVQLWIQFNETQMFQLNAETMRSGNQSQTLRLYQNESPVIFTLNQQMFKESDYDVTTETMFFNHTQIQYVLPAFYSDTNWIISDDLKLALQKYACVANIQANQQIFNSTVPPGCEQYVNEKNVKNVQIGFLLKTSFERSEPSGAQKASGMQQRNLNLQDAADRELVNQLSEIMNLNCSADNSSMYTLNITDFYTHQMLLGETTEATPIQFQNLKLDSEKKRNLLLTYKCKGQWAISTGKLNQEKKVEFIMFNQRVQTGWLQGMNIAAFYWWVMMAISGYLRPIMIFLAKDAFKYETNYPDPMLRLIESIHLARARGDIVTEEMNFRLLQDIIRSQELLHCLTGYNSKLPPDPNKKTIAPTDKEQHSHLIPKAYY